MGESMNNDTELWHALQHTMLGYYLKRQETPGLKLDDYLPTQLKRLIAIKAFGKSTLNVLKRLRNGNTPAQRFTRMYENCARIFAGRAQYQGLNDKERLRHCFNVLRAWGALASCRLAGPKSVPANAPQLAKAAGVFFISQSDYDQFIDASGMITKPLALSYFCPQPVKQRLIDTLYSFGFGIAVPCVAEYRNHVFLLQSSTAASGIDKVEF